MIHFFFFLGLVKLIRLGLVRLGDGGDSWLAATDKKASGSQTYLWGTLMLSITALLFTCENDPFFFSLQISINFCIILLFVFITIMGGG